MAALATYERISEASARLFSAGERSIQPTIAATRLKQAPINRAMGAPYKCAKPPVKRLPSGTLPANTTIYTLITLPRKWSGVTVCNAVFEFAENAIIANPTAAIRMSESTYRCDKAKKISSTENTNAAINKYRTLGLRFPQASQRAEHNDPSPNAAERKPNPIAPECSTSVAKRGRITLKLMPNSEITPITAIMSNMEGVWMTYDRPSRKLCKVLCFDVSPLVVMRFASACSSFILIRASPTITGTKLIALSRKSGAIPSKAMMRPPSPGPTTRAILKTDEFNAMALGKSSRPTISTTKACLVGISNELVRPNKLASTNTSQTCIWPLATRIHSTTACSIANDCVNKSTRRFGKRSARTPPNSESSITGKNCNAPTTPSNQALWVNSRTSQA